MAGHLQHQGRCCRFRIGNRKVYCLLRVIFTNIINCRQPVERGGVVHRGKGKTDAAGHRGSPVAYLYRKGIGAIIIFYRGVHIAVGCHTGPRNRLKGHHTVGRWRCQGKRQFAVIHIRNKGICHHRVLCGGNAGHPLQSRRIIDRCDRYSDGRHFLYRAIGHCISNARYTIKVCRGGKFNLPVLHSCRAICCGNAAAYKGQGIPVNIRVIGQHIHRHRGILLRCGGIRLQHRVIVDRSHRYRKGLRLGVHPVGQRNRHLCRAIFVFKRRKGQGGVAALLCYHRVWQQVGIGRNRLHRQRRALGVADGKGKFPRGVLVHRLRADCRE